LVATVGTEWAIRAICFDIVDLRNSNDFLDCIGCIADNLCRWFAPDLCLGTASVAQAVPGVCPKRLIHFAGG
jgi:hypothetical protein